MGLVRVPFLKYILESQKLQNSNKCCRLWLWERGRGWWQRMVGVICIKFDDIFLLSVMTVRITGSSPLRTPVTFALFSGVMH